MEVTATESQGQDIIRFQKGLETYIDVVNYNSIYFIKFVATILNLILVPEGIVFLQKAKEHTDRKQPLGSLQCTHDTPEGETKVLL